MTREHRMTHLLAELARGQASLDAARALLELSLHNDAVSRAYYAAYHHVAALLLTEGLEARSRAGIGALLGQHFVLTRRIDGQVAKGLSRLQQFRGEADYNRFFEFTLDSAAEEVAVAESVCKIVRVWLRDQGWAEG